MARYLCATLIVLLLAGVSFAQSAGRVEVFGGYAYIHPDFTSSVSGGASGWDFGAGVRIVRYAGIVADFSGFSPSGPNPCPSCGGGPFATYHTYMGGPQVSIPLGRIKPFARFLMGSTRGSHTGADEQFLGSFSGFTYGAGGGADIGLNKWFAIRGQADWLHISALGTTNMARVGAGLVFRF